MDILRSKAIAAIVLVCFVSSSLAAPAQRIVMLPEGTRIYLELLEKVSGKRGEAAEGGFVRARVWRDVTVDGATVIKAGTISQVRVDKVQHSRMFGMKGKLALGAVETKSVDDQVVALTGGYHKEGKSYAGVTTAVFLVVFWPAMFVFGKAAELPAGTVFDCYTVNTIKTRLEGAEAAPVFSLSSMQGPQFSAEFLMDNLTGDKPPESFQIRVRGPSKIPAALVIDTVNGKPVEPLPLTIVSTTPMGETIEMLTEVSVKTLAKHFQKGINRVEVAYTADGERAFTEAILNAQL